MTTKATKLASLGRSTAQRLVHGEQKTKKSRSFLFLA